jgi:hypothetical protein
MTQEDVVNTNVSAGALAGFLLEGLTVSIAAELEKENAPAPSRGAGIHQLDPSSTVNRHT